MLLLGLYIAITGFAQKGLDIGLSGTVGTTFVWRQNTYGILQAFSDPLVQKSELAYRFSLGGTGAVEVGYNFTDNLGIRTAFQYSFTGQKYEDNFVGPCTIPEGTFGSASVRVNVKRVIKLQFVQIPLLFKFTSNGKLAKFFVSIGPQVGFRTSAYEQVKIHDYIYDEQPPLSANDKFKTIDIGLALQTGVDLYFGKHLYIELGLAGYTGISDINGSAVRGWLDQNHTSYQKSHDSILGLIAGVHYIITQKKSGAGKLDETKSTKKRDVQ